MAPQESWTPYGLEAIRIRHLRRRRILATLLLVAAMLVILLTIDSGTRTLPEIFANGNKVSSGNNQIQIDLPDEQKPKNGPVTVAISPGRVTLADTQQSGPESTVQRTSLPTLDRGNALNWNYYLLLYGPWALLGLALLFLAKRKSTAHEVNYGVYKGSMPLEMISAAARDRVFTTREAKTSLFGRRAEDHVPVATRVPQEGDP